MWKRLVNCRTWWMTVASVLLSAVPAQAFYWYDWPGSRIPPPRTVIPPPEWPEGPQWPGDPPSVTPPVVTPPGAVPEPGTAVAALVGLGAIAIARAWRKKHRQPSGS